MKEKILIVDDDPLVSRLIKIKLENWGYDTVAINDPLKCLETVEKEHPDLVLLDVMMPGTDGISVCSEIRKDHRIPVIMVSSLDDSSTRHDASLFGAIEYVTKPIDDNELKTKVAAVLKLDKEMKKRSN